MSITGGVALDATVALICHSNPDYAATGAAAGLLRAMSACGVDYRTTFTVAEENGNKY
jgi:nanoRNase/pAp phosphatase (c-di-AMP/oligoRNAs hydrolase)